MNKIFKWNGEDFKFSAMDADMMEKFEPVKDETMKALIDYEESRGLDGMLDAEGVREECKILDTFFDKIFGEGTSEKMFDGFDLHERTAAINKLINLRDNQVDSYNKLVKSMAGQTEE